MDIGVVRGLFTAAILLLFLGIWAWSWSRKRRSDFDAAAQLPLEDDRQPPGNVTNKEQSS
jgi:cytochrome c oxidase cbb3-type subunit IV